MLLGGVDVNIVVEENDQNDSERTTVNELSVKTNSITGHTGFQLYRILSIKLRTVQFNLHTGVLSYCLFGLNKFS